jgi:hypothetical protein
MLRPERASHASLIIQIAVLLQPPVLESSRYFPSQAFARVAHPHAT